MARKVIVTDDEFVDNKKPKKKRGKCCGCCIAVLIFILIILAAAFGVGWYFGDRFTREYLDMSLGDTLGVVGDLYWANDQKVVKNPYTNDDREGFYKEIKRNIMLKEDVEVDFDGALEKAIENYFESVKNESAIVSRSLNDKDFDGEKYEGDGEEYEGETDGGADIMNIFVDMIADVLNRDNIDTERLNAYNESDPATDSYILKLKDKELAAFLGKAIEVTLKNAGKYKLFEKLGWFEELGASLGIDVSSIISDIDMSRLASLKQITFVATEKDAGTVKATRADVTLWIGLQDAAGQLLQGVLDEKGMSWANPLSKGLVNMLLPKNFYINVGIPLYGDGKPVVSLNDMSDAKRERAYKLINAVLALNGGENETVDDMLAGAIEDIKPVLEQAADMMEFDEIDNGVIKADLLDIVAKTASESFEGDPLTKAGFIYLLQALFSDPEIRLDELEPYRYTNWYMVDGKEVYIKNGDPDKEPIDYEREFIKEIENKYALKFKDEAKLNDVLAMLGVSLDGDESGEMGSTDLLDMIDGQKFNDLLYRDIKDIKLNVTDRMLAAALSGQLNGLLTGGESDFAGAQITLDALTFVKNEKKPNKLYALLAVEADLTGLAESMDGDLMTRIAAGLMPEKLVLTITVDITRNRVAGETPDPVEFKLNSCENTDRALNVLEKLSPSLDLGAMSSQIDEMLNGMLDQMYKTLDVQFIASEAVKTDGVWTGNTGALVLPDIFTFVADNVLVKDDGEYVVTPDELKTVLRELNDTSRVVVTPGIAESYSGFINEVVDKYYLNPSESDDLSTFEGLTAFMSDFDTDKFRLTGEDPNKKYLAYDARSTSELEPVMTGAELGALIKEQMGDGVRDYAVKSVSTGEDSLTVVLSISMGNLMPEDVKFLVTADELFITATVDMSEVVGDGDEIPYRYAVSVKLNDMNAATYKNTLDIVRFFTPEFDIEAQVNEFGEILYTQMQSINNSFTPSVDTGVDAPDASGANFFRFTERGLVMNDFYTFLANKMNLTIGEDVTADTVKAAVQGMYARSTVEELANENNYVYGDIVVNAGDSNWTGGAYPQPGKTYSDKAFNAYIANGVEGRGSVRAVQTISLSKLNVSQTANDIRAWLSDRVATENKLIDTSDYLAVTFRMDMDDFMKSDNDKSGGFLPTSVVVTFVYKYDVGEFTGIGVILNDMKYKEYTVLVQLMGLSPDNSDENDVNINTVNDATLARIKNAQLTSQADGNGVGGILVI